LSNFIQKLFKIKLKTIIEHELKLKELHAKLNDEIALKERFKLDYESCLIKISEMEKNPKVVTEVCHCNQDKQRKIVSVKLQIKCQVFLNRNLF
jgi:hypothetical protein